MKRLVAFALVIGLVGCGDFVDEDGNTSIRQVAEGLQSLGDRVAELGEALERDADVEAVPWQELMQVIPSEVEGARRLDSGGDAATDRNGAGISMAHAAFAVHGDSIFVGVADLGALRSGVGVALRWVAPLFVDGDVDGDLEELELRGYPAIRVRDEDGDLLVALMVAGRFAVISGAQGAGNEALSMDALAEVDFDRLEGWADYGTR